MQVQAVLSWKAVETVEIFETEEGQTGAECPREGHAELVPTDEVLRVFAWLLSLTPGQTEF